MCVWGGGGEVDSCHSQNAENKKEEEEGGGRGGGQTKRKRDWDKRKEKLNIINPHFTIITV